jgi:hypothetical protein
MPADIEIPIRKPHINAKTRAITAMIRPSIKYAATLIQKPANGTTAMS